MEGKRILVAYASKYGATAQIGEYIAARLNRCGFSASAQSISSVDTPSGYDACVVGSGVYAGMWLKEAADFLKKFESDLARMPVWLFSDGPTGVGNPNDLMKGWRFPADLQPVADRIQPKDIVFFHGALDMDKLKFAEKLIVRALKAPVGDFRDWSMIDTWADAIASSLKP
jgi:menaquinone-dependent protoporphyrinogen oxidase